MNMNILFFMACRNEEIPILVFDYNYHSILPALYYNNPDFFSHSFFFQVYRKQIVSNHLESNKVISFLRKQGISNDIICLHMMNYEQHIPLDLFYYGFFSLKSISNLNPKELSKFKQTLRMDMNMIIGILKNQLYEVFLDFMKNGKSDQPSLLDKSNQFSKLIIEAIFTQSSILCQIKFQKANIMTIKNMVDDYLLFMFNFLDENKMRKIAILSSFSFLLFPHPNIFDSIEERKKKRGK